MGLHIWPLEKIFFFFTISNSTKFVSQIRHGNWRPHNLRIQGHEQLNKHVTIFKTTYILLWIFLISSNNVGLTRGAPRMIARQNSFSELQILLNLIHRSYKYSNKLKMIIQKNKIVKCTTKKEEKEKKKDFYQQGENISDQI